MPELPDLTVYQEALDARLIDRRLEGIRLGSPFVLRSVTPRPAELVGHSFLASERVGKRLVLPLDGDFFIVIHLMVAGRFQWKNDPKAKIPGKIGLAAFDLPNGTLVLTEASTKKRASIHLVAGRERLEVFERGGIEPLRASPFEFAATLRRERHTLKRALTDPTLFAGIGNAYSDEILHRARMSPVARTDRLSDEDIEQLQSAVVAVLEEWTQRLREETGGAFPSKVTAFREEMAVHGRFGQPCPRCGTAVQRIVYAENESNYCPRCQTGGKLLADRSLSRLLRENWPKTIEELEGR
jgi:formamidopyrimidine-DNA glycosylase